MTVRAFVIDDSAVARTATTALLRAGGIEVAGAASDPLFAWPRLQQDWPDVLVLDLEMPRMDGLTFLRRLMALHPMPVVMCSTLTARGAPATVEALAAGAVAVVEKPRSGLKAFLEDPGNGLVETVRAAARARVRAPAADASGGAFTALARTTGTTASATAPRRAPAAVHAPAGDDAPRVVALGLSTGGVQALEAVLRGLDARAPGLVVVQHMPPAFTTAFAERLDRLLPLEVREARDGDLVRRGRVLVAPGGRHVRLRRAGAGFAVEVLDGPLVNHHRPSVDVLFRSVAACAGPAALGVVMTGMGDDGARGLRDMKAAGARTAAQDEATSVVFGMPAEAIRLSAADDVLPLAEVAGWILRHGRPATTPRTVSLLDA